MEKHSAGLFDLNKDGKIDASEKAIEFAAVQSMMTAGLGMETTPVFVPFPDEPEAEETAEAEKSEDK